MATVMNIEDEPGIRKIIRRTVEKEGFGFLEAESGGQAKPYFRNGQTPDAVLLDLRLKGDMDGLAVLRWIKERHQGLPVIICSGHGDVQTAVEAVKAGAYDFITKPFDPQHLLVTVNRALEKSKLNAELGALRKSSLQAGQLMSAITSILIGVDRIGTVIEWNGPAERILGRKREEVLGTAFTDCVLSWDRDLVRKGLIVCIKKNMPVPVEDVPYTAPDGRRGLLGITFNPIRTDRGTPAGFIIMGKDITLRKEMEGQLAQARKMEAIGQLAAGIAHEINTPMQYVGDSTTFLQGACSELLEKCLGPLAEGKPAAMSREDLAFIRDEIPRGLTQIAGGVEHVTRIVRAMKDFSHPDSENPELLDINRAVENVFTITRNEWKYAAEIKLDLDKELPPVSCFPGKLNQALLNLVVNAAHAITEKNGNESDARGIIHAATRLAGSWAEIRISDTGNGIPDAIRDRVFEPFFTTKPTGKGTGQGLAIAHSVVVKNHGGKIDFTSVPGTGTTFTIRLPYQTQGALA